MFTALTALYIRVAALLPIAEPAPGVNLNSGAVVTFVVTKILPIIFAFIGVMVLINAKKSRMSDVFETVAKAVIACAIIGAGGVLYQFGGTLVKVFIN